jgi:hypothetical protein
MSRWSMLTGVGVTVLLVACVQSALAATDVVAGTTNIAAASAGGWVVNASSQAKDAKGQVLPNWQVANAIDELYVVGNHTPPNSYGWSTDSPPTAENPHWIILAFGKPPKTHLVSRVVIDPTTDDPFFIGRWAKDIEIQVSRTEKDGPYRSVGRFMIVNKPIKQAFDFPPVECLYMRSLITGNHGSDKCVELGEVEVYEAIVGQNQLDELILRMENLLQDLKRYRDAQIYQQEKATLKAVTEKPVPPPTTPATPAPAPAPAPAPPPVEGTGGG